MTTRLIVGDCRDVLPTLPANSVDSIVTDPPYGLGFMGKDWDKNVPGVPFWTEALRVLKPGGYLLAFGGARTYHRMTCAIEDAGFEIRDCIMWLYGSGFPKSHNGEWGGTALKPAHEPIVMARKPLDGTVAANFEKHGTGALNIDACRVPTSGEVNPSIARRSGATNHLSDRPAAESEAEGRLVSRQSAEAYQRERKGEALGRWPANIIHDGSEEVIAAFPDAEGQQGALTGDEPSRPAKNTYGEYSGRRDFAPRIETDKSAARFFYCAKASRAERHAGLQDPGPQFQHGTTLRKVENTSTTGNNHPTVKPIALMRYLCRLVTPPDGTVLDMFMGSGSTGCAAVQEGFDFIGITDLAEHAAIAEVRIAYWDAHGDKQVSLL